MPTSVVGSIHIIQRSPLDTDPTCVHKYKLQQNSLSNKYIPSVNLLVSSLSSSSARFSLTPEELWLSREETMFLRFLYVVPTTWDSSRSI